MMKPPKSTILYLALILISACAATSSPSPLVEEEDRENESPSPEVVEFKLGAERMELWRPGLAGKRVAVVANQTSMLGDVHLVDTLLASGVNVVQVMAPEHGFRGQADAGAHVQDEKDGKTGLPVYSMYGADKRPNPAHMQNIDVIIFDIQDVGVRCYTYISSLHYLMESCAQYDVDLLVLDRPNPNGAYVDGPVLEMEYHSFVGMHPVPLLHGMTIGEYAKMIAGEGWIDGEDSLNMTVVPCSGYAHDMEYELPIPPSPNLPNAASVALYPSLVLFEGTVVSIGRGTEEPFQVVGHPDFKSGDYVFTPRPGPGSKYPKLEGKACRGYKMDGAGAPKVGLVLGPLLLFHRELTQQDIPFFLENLFFDKLAGNSLLREQIASGMDEIEIRESWEADLSAFEDVRANYLIYP